MTVTGEAVKEMRQQRGWSTYDLAREIGCNQSTVWRIENGGVITPVMERVLHQFIRKSQTMAKRVDRARKMKLYRRVHG
ncbi:helix-turn-helix transcriptional regulator [Shinella zoogloeoides]|uniref:helix-turn-helix domain-containing protein n=1 Tax=Shinella zoogloeoides TaxID=352475 RepID=UPI0028A8E00D|nr:helix-turn-helix transcriptional regulator [Shinella zoogloeoides]